MAIMALERFAIRTLTRVRFPRVALAAERAGMMAYEAAYNGSFAVMSDGIQLSAAAVGKLGNKAAAEVNKAWHGHFRTPVRSARDLFERLGAFLLHLRVGQAGLEPDQRGLRIASRGGT